MDAWSIILGVINFLILIIVGVLSFFSKRLYDSLDSLKKDTVDFKIFMGTISERLENNEKEIVKVAKDCSYNDKRIEKLDDKIEKWSFRNLEHIGTVKERVLKLETEHKLNHPHK